MFDRYFLDLGKVLDAKMDPEINFWGQFRGSSFAPSFLIDVSLCFDACFNEATLKNSDFC